jgi:hypothetical protein
LAFALTAFLGSFRSLLGAGLLPGTGVGVFLVAVRALFVVVEALTVRRRAPTTRTASTPTAPAAPFARPGALPLRSVGSFWTLGSVGSVGSL